MYIVKLGGSLYNSAELSSWLVRLSDYAKHEPVVIVPGGGPFAEMIRDAQLLHAFDDQHAHHMAILAMAQYGLLLHALLPAASTIKTPSEAPTADKLSIWIPDDQLLLVDELKQSWHITSDSLALWFAQQHPHSKLGLIKCVAVDSGNIHLLSGKGIIDQGFEDLFQRHPIDTHLFHYQNQAGFPDNGVALV